MWWFKYGKRQPKSNLTWLGTDSKMGKYFFSWFREEQRCKCSHNCPLLPSLNQWPACNLVPEDYSSPFNWLQRKCQWKDPSSINLTERNYNAIFLTSSFPSKPLLTCCSMNLAVFSSSSRSCFFFLSCSCCLRIVSGSLSIYWMYQPFGVSSTLQRPKNPQEKVKLILTNNKGGTKNTSKSFS